MSARGRGRDLAEWLALAGALRAIQALPEGCARWTGRLVGRAAWVVVSRRRRIALANVERVWGARLLPVERRRIARESFVSLGELLAEFARLERLDRRWLERSVTIEGLDGLVEAARRGRGVLLLGAHFGPWELVPHVLALLGHPMAFVVRPADNPRIEALIRGLREGRGNVAIAKRDALLDCMRRLKRGEIVGMLVDQHVPQDRGVPSSLLGLPVHTTHAPAALALRTGAAVLPAFAVREPGDRVRIALGPELALDRTGDRRRDVLVATRAFDAVLGGWVQQRPDHWLWAHRRFRASAGSGAAEDLG